MSLPNYLAQIKSSGIYRFVWDKSEIAGVPAEVLRLVVGYSEKGPFNTPVYIQSDTEFKTIFGDISKKLEKRGIWFHRMALQALSKGPIIALNLKKFKNEKVTACSFDVTDTLNPVTVPVEAIYDTSRFWKLDPSAILTATAALDKKADKYISLTAADSKDTSCSVFIRGYKPTGYDVTVKNWYSSIGEEMPDYFVNGDTDYSSLLVSDFFAEIYVFRGEFTPSLCVASPLNKYFDLVGGVPVLKEYITNAFGEKIDTLNALANDEASNLVNIYRGCLLPYFKSQTGAYISLDLVFNADESNHKMMMNLNSDLLYNGDINIYSLCTTGWTSSVAFGTVLKDTTEIYSGTTVSTVDYHNVYNFSFSPVAGKEPTAHEADFIEYRGAINPEDLLYKYLSGYQYKYTGVADRTINGSSVETLVFVPVDTNKKYLDSKEAVIYNDQTYIWDDDELVLSDLSLVDLETLVIVAKDPVGPTGDTGATGAADTDKTYLYRYQGTDGNYKSYHCVSEDVLENDIYVAPSGKVFKKNPDGAYAEIAGIISSTVYSGDDVNGFDFISAGFVLGDRVLYNDTLYAVSKLSKDFITIIDLKGNELILSRKDTVTKCNHSASISSYGLKPLYFEGYTFESAAPASMADYDKLQWQKNILSTLVDYNGLRTGLTSRTDIDYRYIVDTFEAYVDSEVHKELALICKEKDNALGLLNFPAAKTFKNCAYASFTDENGRFQVKYIAEGANKRKNPGVLFSLVSENNGASFVSYNTPLMFSDGTVKTYCPAAALVSNNFMDKYTSRQPYYVVAGPTYGRLIYSGLVGPDFNYTRADLDILEPMGVNATVYVPRIGTFINSNKTAKQNPVTALSSLNVRELVIYLQDEIEKLLQDYQWEFNTPYLRDLIKAKADTICERVKNNGGILEYLNVCDESNNTSDVIDNEMFVLSTSIEPGRACGKMVQELTIYRTGILKSLIS